MEKLKAIVTGLLIVLALVSVVLYNYFPPEQIEEDELELKYQGPVPEGYDLEFFRETGITKPIGEPQKETIKL